MSFNKRSISAVELGRYLMNICEKWSNSFLERNKDKFDIASRYDINKTELVIAHMWAVYHLVNVKTANSALPIEIEKFLYKVLMTMNTSLVNKYELSKEDADILMELLTERYNEYKNGIISDTKKEEVILSAWASAIVKNITGKPEPIHDVILITLTAIHFNGFGELIEGLLNDKNFKDTNFT